MQSQPSSFDFQDFISPKEEYGKETMNYNEVQEIDTKFIERVLNTDMSKPEEVRALAAHYLFFIGYQNAMENMKTQGPGAAQRQAKSSLDSEERL